MPNPIDISVCVIALTQADFADLDPAVQTQLMSSNPPYDFATPGTPYATSPDDWRPFGSGSAVLDYFAQANFQVRWFSAQLYDNQGVVEALSKTRLYIIDPLVLTHTRKRDALTAQVQTAILIGKDVPGKEKLFCIILPTNVPQPLRDKMAQECVTLLNNLYQIRRENVFFEWLVEDEPRFLDYLNKLANQLSRGEVNPQTLDMTKAFLNALGVAAPNLQLPPGLLQPR